MVLEGRVTVNGKVIDTLGFKADPLKDHIKVDGKRLVRFEPNVTLLLNKPRGYVSTVRDPEDRPTVMDFLKGVKRRIYPVGRLDIDTEGLLLLTNDGDLAYLLSHPRYSVPRTYLAKVSGVPEERDLNRLKRGVNLEDGKAKAVSVSILRLSEKNSWIRIVVTEEARPAAREVLQKARTVGGHRAQARARRERVPGDAIRGFRIDAGRHRPAVPGEGPAVRESPDRTCCCRRSCISRCASAPYC